MLTRFMNGWRRLGVVLVAVWILGAIAVFLYESRPAVGYDVRTKAFVIAAAAIPLALWVAIEIAYVAARWVVRAFRGRAP